MMFPSFYIGSFVPNNPSEFESWSNIS